MQGTESVGLWPGEIEMGRGDDDCPERRRVSTRERWNKTSSIRLY